ncbi:MAG: hypothetical protein E7323_04975 [Clostridiales bacterium]|nr:hypothetical protein [Clostridiales bacterium]MBE5815011.1 hypothetical protein [Clostridiales bacterium]
MQNRKVILIASIVLALALSISGTLAYLTDTDSDVNVMTLGNIQIEQIELQRVEGVDYRNGGEIADGDELEPFEQGQQLFPSYTDDESDYSAKIPDDEQFWWGSYVTADVTGNGSSNGLFDDGLQGALDKFVFVKNTGDSPAYYRTWIALECPESLRYDRDTVAKADLWINTNSNPRFEWTEKEYVDIDGTRFLVFCATYLKELPAGEISRPSLLQVALTGTADSEDIEALGDTYTILTFTQAVQVNNLPDAKTALAAAFGEPTADNHPWGDADVMPNVYVTTPEEMMDALGNGGNIIAPANTEMLMQTDGPISMDANGATVVMNGDGAASGRYGYLAFIPPTGENAEVSNLNVTGKGFVEVGDYDLSRGGTYTVNNLVIKDLAATYSVKDHDNYVACAFGHYGTATLNNCVMTGTTNFKEGYTPYDVGLPNKSTTTINGGEYGSIYLWSQAHATINDAEVDRIDSCAIPNSNLGMLTIGSGTHVKTLNLIPPGNYKTAITIEDGAIIDVINYKGNSYTLEEWLNR